MGEKDKWYSIYPAYINRNRSVAQGRRVPKSKAAEDPRWQEIKEVLESTGSFTVLGEPKSIYPRELDKELPIYQGRVKYQVINPGEQFTSKQKVVAFVGESISKMKNRKTLQSTASVAQTGEGSSDKKTKKGKKK